jgi:Domain of unknown function (DUF4159)
MGLTSKSHRHWRATTIVAALTLLVPIALAEQREFRVYPSFEYQANVELPPDYKEQTEFVVGRLMYPPYQYGRFSRFGGGDWTQGGTSWAVDYPRGDRDFARLLRRITRVHVRSVEQPVNLDDKDDVYYWPFMIMGLAGSWDLTEPQAAKLRDYLLRGGFLLCDSFFGTNEWDGFVATMNRVFPNRPMIDLPADHPIFHTVYDLSSSTQIGNYQSYNGRGVPYRADGDTPRWRGILDDDGRLMVVIAFNNDLGDGWQWSDDENYPLGDANMSIKFGVNIVVYAMTH